MVVRVGNGSERVDVAIEGYLGRSYGDGTVLYLDCVRSYRKLYM